MSQKQSKPYPYRILPVERLDPDQVKLVDLWECLEFFRVEALLRSKIVMDLYKNTYKGKKDLLLDDYAVFYGWGVLEGLHHLYLKTNIWKYVAQEKGKRTVRSGIWHLEELFFHPYWKKRVPDPTTYLENAITNRDPRFLWVRIDTDYSSKEILAELRKEITECQQRQTSVSRMPSIASGDHGGRETTIPWHASKNPPIKDTNAWIDYLKCYDLRHCEAKTYGQIAIKVYGDSKKYEVAEHAYKRVSKLIEYAESNNWPPPSNFLNKK